jgi:hypothetical protein
LNFPFSYSIGQSFNFATSVNHNISAVCDSLYLDSINGQTDSIALIRLTVYNQNSTLDSTHHFNCYYKISKNFGLLQTPDFTSLDSLHYYRPFFGLREKLQCNKSFGLTVGDQFHYRLDSLIYSGVVPKSNYYGYQVHVIGDTLSSSMRTITFREVSGSGIPGQYGNFNTRVSNFSYDTSGYCHSAKSAIIHDTLLHWLQYNTYVPLPIYWVDDSKPIFKLIKSVEFSQKIINYGSQAWPPIVDSIFYAPMYASVYLNYIGLTDAFYYNGVNGHGASSISKSLAYFKKGNQTWGTPLNLVVGLNEEIQDQSELFVFPNPVNETLRIKTKGNYVAIEILNTNGQLVAGFDKQAAYDVSELSSGIYFLRMVSGESVVTRKFVKE